MKKAKKKMMGKLDVKSRMMKDKKEDMKIMKLEMGKKK